MGAPCREQVEIEQKAKTGSQLMLQILANPSIIDEMIRAGPPWAPSHDQIEQMRRLLQHWAIPAAFPDETGGGGDGGDDDELPKPKPTGKRKTLQPSSWSFLAKLRPNDIRPKPWLQQALYDARRSRHVGYNFLCHGQAPLDLDGFLESEGEPQTASDEENLGGRIDFFMSIKGRIGLDHVRRVLGDLFWYELLYVLQRHDRDPEGNRPPEYSPPLPIATVQKLFPNRDDCQDIHKFLVDARKRGATCWQIMQKLGIGSLVLLAEELTSSRLERQCPLREIREANRTKIKTGHASSARERNFHPHYIRAMEHLEGLGIEDLAKECGAQSVACHVYDTLESGVTNAVEALVRTG